MITPWHWMVHVMGADYGLPYGHWGWYNFHSGFGSGYVAIFGAIAALMHRLGRQHRERIAQAARHHREEIEQSEKHHRAHLALARENHGHIVDHLNAQHEAMKAHLRKATGQVIAQADANAQRAADGPVRGGAGSNPASEGLPAEKAEVSAAGSAVPPPAARKSRPRTLGTSRGGEK